MRLEQATLQAARKCLALALCLSMLLWSVQPATSHVPAILDVLGEHAQMIEDHGHSHGLEEDLAWAMHGHSHDAADHDHSSVVLIEHRNLHWTPAVQAAESFPPTGWRSAPSMPHDRPPRD